jgi:hypothetical protein
VTFVRRVQQIQLGILRRDPALKRDAAWTRHLEQVAIPCWRARRRHLRRGETARGPVIRGRLRLSLSGPPRRPVGLRARPPRQRALAPRVVPAGEDTQDAAHGGDRMDGLVCRHELESLDGIVLVSRANQAAAFDRIARSSRSCRNLRSSSASLRPATTCTPSTTRGTSGVPLLVTRPNSGSVHFPFGPRGSIIEAPPRVPSQRGQRTVSPR